MFLLDVTQSHNSRIRMAVNKINFKRLKSVMIRLRIRLERRLELLNCIIFAWQRKMVSLTSWANYESNLFIFKNSQSLATSQLQNL